jgi:hypothetical protein
MTSDILAARRGGIDDKPLLRGSTVLMASRLLVANPSLWRAARRYGIDGSPFLRGSIVTVAVTRDCCLVFNC